MSLTTVGLSGDAPALDLSFVGALALPGLVTFSRASSATDLLSTAAAGAYTTLASNVARLGASGLLLEEARIQQLGVTDAPATQTVTLATGAFTLWIIGSGSVAATAGTGTATGLGTASLGAPNSFTVTGAGTFTFTVAGSVTNFQCENGAFATSYIPNAGAVGTTVTRAIDLATVAVSAFPFNTAAGTFFVEAAFEALAGVNQLIAQFDDGTGSNRLAFFRDQATQFANYFNFPGNTTLADNVVWGSAVQRLATAYLAGNTAFATRGVLVGTDGAALPTGITTLRLGNLAAGNRPLDGWLRRVTYWNGRLTNAQIQSMTT